MIVYNLTYPGDTVIFLDFDGPMLPARLHYEEFNSTIMFDPTASWQDDMALKRQVKFDVVMVNLINRWIQEANAKLVISSNWTKYSTFEEICEILEANGITCIDQIHDCWKTTKLSLWSRAEEIAHWLFINRGTVQNYIIIDDDATVLNDQRLIKEKVLLIDFFNGITWKQIFEGCEILGITDYKTILA